MIENLTPVNSFHFLISALVCQGKKKNAYETRDAYNQWEAGSCKVNRNGYADVLDGIAVVSGHHHGNISCHQT